MKLPALLILCVSFLLLTACGVPSTTEEHLSPVEEVSAAYELTSAAFADGETIPVKYSCDGDDISPPLTWGPPPDGTKSQVLIMDDPDAPIGTWDHWIVFNIPANIYGLEENLPITGINQVPDLISIAQNSWGRNDYGGPCPPGSTHRYFFKLYALDTTLNLDEKADKKQVLSAIDGHILAESELMGTYTR